MKIATRASSVVAATGGAGILLIATAASCVHQGVDSEDDRRTTEKQHSRGGGSKLITSNSREGSSKLVTSNATALEALQPPLPAFASPRHMLRFDTSNRISKCDAATTLQSAPRSSGIFSSIKASSSPSSSSKSSASSLNENSRASSSSSADDGNNGEGGSSNRMPSKVAIDLNRRLTLRRMNSEATENTVEALYKIDPDPLGEGAYGEVYFATNKRTGEGVALKKISKEYTDELEFQREMNALLHIRACGGHPNICQLRENFEEDDNFILILDLIRGGEMFEYLIDNGAYSEWEAARLIREVASALTFLHGVGIIHADLKPENILLSSKNKDEATVKIVDFGCAGKVFVCICGLCIVLHHVHIILLGLVNVLLLRRSVPVFIFYHLSIHLQ